MNASRRLFWFVENHSFDFSALSCVASYLRGEQPKTRTKLLAKPS